MNNIAGPLPWPWLKPTFDALPWGVVMAGRHAVGLRAVYVNAAYESLTGYSAQEVLGQAHFLPDAAIGEPADWTVIDAAVAHSSAAHAELNALRKDGAVWRASLAIAPILDEHGVPAHYVGVLSDITERQQAHAALVAQRDQLLDYVAHAPLGVLALDWVMSGIFIIEASQPDTPIIYVNAAFERLTGLAAEAVVGRNHAAILAVSGNTEIIDQVREAMQRQMTLKTELHGRRADGAGFWCELNLSPVFDQRTQTTHYLGILNDITERKQNERRLNVLSEELRKSCDNLLSVLDEFPSGTLIVEADGTVAFCSASCRRILDIQPDAALGQHWRQALPFDPESGERLQRGFDTSAQMREALVIGWRDSGGGARWVECSIKDDPLNATRRILFVDDVTELHRLRDRLESSRYAGLLGECEAMRTLNRLIGEVARGNWSVLIEGETGVGKELVARAIHDASPRQPGAFIAVNSAGLSESLLASQLFGHRKGAFTGAVSDQSGFFEAAAGGTLFLDEIGDLPLGMQAALLRVLQEHEITRLGETRARPVDVRIIAATHRDLAAEARLGRFREDLLFRLRVARIHIPPLRARKTDIPLLAAGFLNAASAMAGKTVHGLDTRAMQCLLDYDWPGNVRELRACIDFAVIHCHGVQIGVADLPPELRRLPEAAHMDKPLMSEADADDPAHVRAALQKARGNRSRAARLLGVSRSTLYRRLRELHLDEKN